MKIAIYRLSHEGMKELLPLLDSSYITITSVYQGKHYNSVTLQIEEKSPDSLYEQGRQRAIKKFTSLLTKILLGS